MVMVGVLLPSMVDLEAAWTTGEVVEVRLLQVVSEAVEEGDQWPRSRCLVTVGEGVRDRDSAAVVGHSSDP